jgi:CheY-like chemotaxis protein
MTKELVILIAEDDMGHFVLTKNYLKRMGIRNEIIRLADGQETLDFLNKAGPMKHTHRHKQYVLLLDIRMPKIDGIEILEKIKESAELLKVPVVMLTTSENPHHIQRCYSLGCHSYIVKPVKYSSYLEAMRQVGLYPSMVSDGVVLIKKQTA